ncbi:hypothetical protein BSL78_00218 [Apostichopus japonicus]|uniref:Uncharacterized protein n=1 Tax=Stichopus japonicus TaxID=307972 RepID=A0A2G8LRN3_STIJA|nr:hypothetical protein BSL78_00218 [Apostichopus japonicus]
MEGNDTITQATSVRLKDTIQEMMNLTQASYERDTPIIGSLARYFSYRQLGIAGGSLVGGGFICSGLFSNHGLHFLGFFCYISNSVDKSEPIQEVEAFDKDSHNFTNLKYGLLPLMKYFRFFAIVLKEHLSLFLDLTFTLFFITANTRRFPSDNWTLFLIPYNQELGMTKSNAVFIAAVGGFGGIVGRFVAAASFKLTKIISPLTLFALCYCLNAIIFASFSLWNNPIFLTFCGFSSALLLSFLAGTTSGILLQLSSPETFRPAFGLLHFGCGIFSIFAGILSGKSYDVFGSFAVMFEVNALLNAVSCVLVVVIIVLRKLNYKNTIQN